MASLRDKGGGFTLTRIGAEHTGTAYFQESRSRVFRCSLNGSQSNNETSKPTVNESDFLDLFYGGELSRYEQHMKGFTVEGKSTYKVTFKKYSNKTLEELDQKFLNQPHTLVNACGKNIIVKMIKPFAPTVTITMRPVPLEYEVDNLKQIITKMGWGVPDEVKRGLHKAVGPVWKEA